MEEEQLDVQEQSSAPEQETAQTVPYTRFSQEVAKRKALEERLAALETQELPAQEVPKPRFDHLADQLSVLRKLDDDEVAELQTRAKELNVDPVTFAKSPVWSAHLNALRANRKAENNTPEPSSRVAVYEGKTFAEVATSDATPAEKQAAFIAQRDAILKRGRNQLM